MFTGLIETVGAVARIERRGGAALLTVSATLPAADVALGDSIAVNGACLTVVAKGGGTFTFDVSPETWTHTTFRHLTAGAPVNLERALRLGDRLDGHIVTGHVDCVASVIERRETDDNIVFTFHLPPEHARHLVAKGSVAVDGVSLTVNSVSDDGFSVNIIPHTASRTTLHGRRRGESVNIETDILGKYVERLVRGGGGGGTGLTLELLAKSGFL
ncbi:MAG TPA: riboflavin synthase [Geobacteraceae bacterium]